ncbi:Flp pilus assembly protein TadD/cell division septation protein DedD [Sphingobium sp. B2D3A]|uniref:SPOR domain-containing protein n=1 Tax=unclassified Sphingobium TaxID=2611147 RepID=UPI0022259DB8|nr:MULTISPECIES: SPOR domain-containing protein [unclassified Sphingobium]MCW2337590.1 Flp pilus assembly protein TadD/cell division septation protein DedD [Sphingobium sp. B2D3A]MCW2384048.1 Flp pilus assembly protein TadD/cell division septation protein DedD [Sphingobium sp. B2D3D]
MALSVKMPLLLVTVALSSVTLGGCAQLGLQSHSARATPSVAQLSPKIESALADRKFAHALNLAEALVAAEPAAADHRVLLGRAYLANGRYRSAQAAFTDAMALGNSDVRTIISLALCETALGNDSTAQALLADNAATLPASDYGLAMAMAGDVQEGVRALVYAARQPDASAQTRQNLAFALALGGAWGQARLIAGQDLSAKEAEQRIGRWSQAVAQAEPGARVAALTGVAPRADDAGMPSRLALRSFELPAVAELAPPKAVVPSLAKVAEGAEGAEPAVAADTERAAPAVQSVAIPPPSRSSDPAGPAKANPPIASSANPTFGAPSAEILSAAPLLVLQPGPRAPDIAQIAFAPAASSPSMGVKIAAASRAVPARPGHASGDWVMQLGAFDSATMARVKWQDMRRNPRVAGYREIVTAASVNGRTFHRVAVGGFASRGAAGSLCQTLRGEGQACYVRRDDSNASRMARAGASAGGSQFASR